MTSRLITAVSRIRLLTCRLLYTPTIRSYCCSLRRTLLPTLILPIDLWPTGRRSGSRRWLTHVAAVKRQSLEANTQKTKNKNIAGHDERHGLWSCLQNQNFCLLHPRTTFLSFFFYRTFALPYFYRVYDIRNSANRNIVFQLYGKQVKIIKPLPLKLL